MNNNCNNPCQIINVLGPQGPQGPQGQIGPQGPQGPQGIPGLPLTNNFLSLQSVNLNLAYPDNTTYQPVFYQTEIGNGNTITAVLATGVATLAAGHTYFIMISLDGSTQSQTAGRFYTYRVLINGNPMPVTPGTEWECESLNINTSFIYPANVDTTIQVEISTSNSTAASQAFLRGAFLNIVQLI